MSNLKSVATKFAVPAAKISLCALMLASLTGCPVLLPTCTGRLAGATQRPHGSPHFLLFRLNLLSQTRRVALEPL